MNTDIQNVWSDLHHELAKFISRKVPDSSLVEDILQDVFIKIHLNISQLKDPSRLTAWVYQITRNTITDYGKSQRFLDGATLAEMAEEENQESIYVSLSNCINHKIANLSPRDRDVVLLTYFQNYSQKELASFLGISYSGTKNRVQRVRKKLRLAILSCDNVETDTQGRVIKHYEKKM